MNDKTRAEFEEAFPLPGGVYWSESYNEYSWNDYFYIQEAFSYQGMFNVWLAAKEKYEPRWIPVSERLPKIDQYVAWSCDDGYMIFAGRDKYDPDGYWEDQFKHWAAINPPSTQGGGE